LMFHCLHSISLTLSLYKIFTVKIISHVTSCRCKLLDVDLYLGFYHILKFNLVTFYP
jgi:hypothetical protein